MKVRFVPLNECVCSLTTSPGRLRPVTVGRANVSCISKVVRPFRPTTVTILLFHFYSHISFRYTMEIIQSPDCGQTIKALIQDVSNSKSKFNSAYNNTI